MLEKLVKKELRLSNVKLLFSLGITTLLFLTIYLILAKENENYRHAIQVYESEIAKLELNQSWVEELVEQRKKFVDMDTILEQSFDKNQKFLRVLDSILANFPSTLEFAELRIEKDVGYLEIVAHDAKLISRYCEQLMKEDMNCQFNFEKVGKYEVVIERKEYFQ